MKFFIPGEPISWRSSSCLMLRPQVHCTRAGTCRSVDSWFGSDWTGIFKGWLEYVGLGRVGQLGCAAGLIGFFLGCFFCRLVQCLPRIIEPGPLSSFCVLTKVSLCLPMNIAIYIWFSLPPCNWCDPVGNLSGTVSTSKVHLMYPLILRMQLMQRYRWGRPWGIAECGNAWPQSFRETQDVAEWTAHLEHLGMWPKTRIGWSHAQGKMIRERCDWKWSANASGQELRTQLEKIRSAMVSSLAGHKWVRIIVVKGESWDCASQSARARKRWICYCI